MQILEEKNHLVQESEKIKKQLDDTQHERVKKLNPIISFDSLILYFRRNY
jgi:hypothetical protein